MATVKSGTEDSMTNAIAYMQSILLGLNADITDADNDDQRIVSLSCVIAKANRALSNLASARMCYRSINNGSYLGGGEE